MLSTGLVRYAGEAKRGDVTYYKSVLSAKLAAGLDIGNEIAALKSQSPFDRVERNTHDRDECTQFAAG